MCNDNEYGKHENVYFGISNAFSITMKISRDVPSLVKCSFFTFSSCPCGQVCNGGECVDGRSFCTIFATI